MSGTVKLDGLKELNKALKKLEGKVARKIAREGLKAAAVVIRKEMRRRAPIKTGQLRKRIRYRLKRMRGGAGYTGKVGVDVTVFYARFIEYGTTPHRIPNGSLGRGRNKRKNDAKLAFGGRVLSRVQHPGTPARPFLRPAYESVKNTAVRAIGPRMWALIKRETRK